MNKKDFKALLAGVEQMGQHMRGKPVPGARIRKVDDIQARKVRLAAGPSLSLSQTAFARLSGVLTAGVQSMNTCGSTPGTIRASARA